MKNERKNYWHIKYKNEDIQQYHEKYHKYMYYVLAVRNYYMYMNYHNVEQITINKLNTNDNNDLPDSTKTKNSIETKNNTALLKYMQIHTFTYI